MLVHGGSGGVGTALLDLGKLENLTMYATASQHKHDVVKVLGAEPIDYKSQDFVKVITDLTQNTGIDIVMDSVSGSYTERSYNLLREGGRYVSFGWQNMIDFNMDEFDEQLKKTDAYNDLKDSKTTYSYLGMEIDGSQKELYREYLTKLVSLFSDGKLNPIIKRMKLSEASKAHKLVENSNVKGKIVLVPDHLY